MPRLRQVGKDAAHPAGQAMYKALFGDRDPVKEPGTATGTPGNWWTVWALVPDAFDHAVEAIAASARELLDSLETTQNPRNRDEVAAKAREKAALRFA